MLFPQLEEVHLLAHLQIGRTHFLALARQREGVLAQRVILINEQHLSEVIGGQIAFPLADRDNSEVVVTLDDLRLNIVYGFRMAIYIFFVKFNGAREIRIFEVVVCIIQYFLFRSQGVRDSLLRILLNHGCEFIIGIQFQRFISFLNCFRIVPFLEIELRFLGGSLCCLSCLGSRLLYRFGGGRLLRLRFLYRLSDFDRGGIGACRSWNET